MAKGKVFIDVDVQRDFCEETGALYREGLAERRLPAAHRARGARTGIPIIGSVDSHSWDAWEFASNDVPAPAGAEKPDFPDHCVKGTDGWLKVHGTLPPRFRFVPNVPVGRGTENRAEQREHLGLDGIGRV